VDWLIALPIVFAAVTALYAASWVFIGLAGIVGRSKHPSKNTPADVIGSRSANRHAVLTAKLGKLGVVVLVGLTERSIEGPTCWAVIGRRFGLL
jgi:hypothetical protein